MLLAVQPPRTVVALLVLAGLPHLALSKQPVTIDAVLNAPGSGLGSVTWAPDGERFITIDRDDLCLYDVRSGKERTVIALKTLRDAAVPVTPARNFDWTNRRVGERDVQWFADGRRLMVSTGGDLFVVDLNKGRFEPLTQSPEYERDPKLSPDNHYVSFRRGPDLYTVEVESKVVTRLTTTGSETLLNGEMDWVYPEELDLETAHWWSPDSRSIAYLQFDVSREPEFPMVSLLQPHALLEPERYPQPGDPNAEVRVGIVPAAGGQTRWMQLGDPRDFLLARVVWSPDSRAVLAERLNRIQSKLDLLLADAETGVAHSVLHEEDATWINVRGAPVFLDNTEFLWTSERTGFRHLYIYKTGGTLEKQLTSGNWEVESVAAIDRARQRVLFTSTEAGPAERQLYAVGLDGSNMERLTKRAGTHSISVSPNGKCYVDDFSSLDTPPQRAFYKLDGTEIREYRVAAPPASKSFDILPTQIVNVKASDGTPLYARLIKPAGFQPGKKYPAVVMVYGGPEAQYVRNIWTGVSWDQVLAQNGFVVWQLDNRGSSGRGHRFESAIYHDMGAHELSDQKDGIQYLIAQGFVDPARIGLYGWSYGGFMTLYTITHAPGLIKAAIAGAPVTDWRNYDTIYTERYMGLPEDDIEGYRNSSPILSAPEMGDTKLLIVHNVEDDNVHFENSVQMAAALENAGKQFSMLTYPEKTHGVNGPERRQLLDTTTKFFEENLK